MNASSSGGHFLNRMVWAYEGWLQGYNGGPLRQPTMKIHGPQMNMLRTGLTRSGLKPTDSPDKEFFVGPSQGTGAPQPNSRWAGMPGVQSASVASWKYSSTENGLPRSM